MSAYICPHCKKPLYDDEALLCFYCGESLGRSVGFMGKLGRPKHKIIILIIIAGILLSFIILIAK